MPTIDWTADQGEEVRQMILDRIDYLREHPATGAHHLLLLQDLREILKKLEAAYAND